MVVLYIMTQKGYEILQFLVQKGYQTEIESVVCSRDRNLDKDYYEEIMELCRAENIRFYDRSEKFNTASEYSIAISWRWIINEVKNLIVLHDSKLPKYRGFAPLVNALKNGEREIGVTALFASEEYDKGDIIFQSVQTIDYPITIQQAIDKIVVNYTAVIEFLFERIKEKKIIPGVKQDESDATYSLWLNEDDYRIDWRLDSSSIKRFIDAVGYPYEGALAIADGKMARILGSECIDDVQIENRTAGKIIFFHGSFPVVVCGKGLLKITRMIDDSDRSDLLPLKKFRLKFL